MRRASPQMEESANGKREVDTGTMTELFHRHAPSLFAYFRVQASKGQAIATAVKAIPVRAHQVYMKPGEGKVEVYWNGQLVALLHFRVK
jgi:hypothetical protein